MSETVPIVVAVAAAFAAVVAIVRLSWAGRRARPHDERAADDPSRRERDALSSHRRDEFVARWQRAQSQFVRAPERAVEEADSLLRDVLATRGYDAERLDTLDSFAADYYRAARECVDAGGGELRIAMQHYRALFAELLDVRDGVTNPA